MPAKIKSKNYIFSLIVMIVLMFLFYRSFYWQNNEIGKRKILEIFIIIFGIVVVPVIAVTVTKINDMIGRFLEGFITATNYLRKNIKKVALFAGIFIFLLVLSAGIEVIIDKFIYHTEFNILRYYIVAAFNAVVYVLCVARKSIASKPEIAFFVIVIIMGITFIKVTPPIVGVSWDDEIHYERTLSIANIFNGISYSSDNKMMDEYGDNIYARVGYDRQSRNDYLNKLDKMYENRKIDNYTLPSFSVSYISYIPAAIGIILARGAGLSYLHIFEMGKLFNLLLYACLFYFAIKKIKYGKYFVAVFGMLPLLVFLASSYSYDSWITAFSVLGFSYLMASIQETDVKKCTNDMIWGSVFIAVGCIVKQVYFPLIFTAVFVALYNYKEYADKKKYIIKIVAIVALFTLFLLASFVIPILLANETATDTRGGADVNAISQIKYVLSNPLIYVKSLLSFFKSYLAIENMSYLTLFGYAGNGEYWAITVVTLIIVAFLDRNSEYRNYKLIRFAGVIMSFGAIVLVASALYAAFTPVGATTVAGCSPRYIVPILLPVLYLIAPDGVDIKFNKKMLFIIPILIFSVVILNSLNMLCATCYITG